MTDIFYDIETRTWAGDHLLGWDEIAEFGLAVGVTWCECHGFVVWFDGYAEWLFDYLMEHDQVVGFNIIRFDNTVIAADAHLTHRRAELDAKSFDILVDLADRLGHRVKLEQVASATLGRGKTGDGAKAVAWWKAYDALKEHEPDEAAMYWKRVVDYCRADVELERDIYRFGVEHGYVRYESRGEIKKVQVDWGRP